MQQLVYWYLYLIFIPVYTCMMIIVYCYWYMH